MPHDSPAPIRCSEVWGGNHAVQTRLDLPGLEGWVISRPHAGDDAGGDVHLVSSCGTGRITRVLLADVSGHGQQVATISGRLRAHMQRYLNHIQPRRLAAGLNRDMIRLAEGSGQFATALICTFFAPTGQLTICNAGHPSPLLYRRATGRWTLLDQPDKVHDIQNLPLGVVESSGYVGRRVRMEMGDVAILYTDCLSEARVPGENDMLGVEGLMHAIADAPTEQLQAPPPVLLEQLLKTLRQRRYAWDDDLTMVVLRCTQRSYGSGVRAFLSGLGRAFRSLFTRQPVPWPDLSWSNVSQELFHNWRRTD